MIFRSLRQSKRHTTWITHFAESSCRRLNDHLYFPQSSEGSACVFSLPLLHAERRRFCYCSVLPSDWTQLHTSSSRQEIKWTCNLLHVSHNKESVGRHSREKAHLSRDRQAPALDIDGDLQIRASNILEVTHSCKEYERHFTLCLASKGRADECDCANRMTRSRM